MRAAGELSEVDGSGRDGAANRNEAYTNHVGFYFMLFSRSPIFGSGFAHSGHKSLPDRVANRQQVGRLLHTSNGMRPCMLLSLRIASAAGGQLHKSATAIAPDILRPIIRKPTSSLRYIRKCCVPRTQCCGKRHAAIDGLSNYTANNACNACMWLTIRPTKDSFNYSISQQRMRSQSDHSAVPIAIDMQWHVILVGSRKTIHNRRVWT